MPNDLIKLIYIARANILGNVFIHLRPVEVSPNPTNGLLCPEVSGNL